LCDLCDRANAEKKNAFLPWSSITLTGTHPTTYRETDTNAPSLWARAPAHWHTHALQRICHTLYSDMTRRTLHKRREKNDMRERADPPRRHRALRVRVCLCQRAVVLGRAHLELAGEAERVTDDAVGGAHKLDEQGGPLHRQAGNAVHLLHILVPFHLIHRQRVR
jgi:hypothetical protein